MMRLRWALLCATALVSTSAALADDSPAYKAAPAPTLAIAPPPYSWTGFHVGLGGGFSALQVKSSSASEYFNTNPTGYLAAGGEKSDLGKFGAFGTIEAGGDYQFDRFVVGALADFNLGSARVGSQSAAACFGYCNFAVHSVFYKIGNSWDLAARLGFLLNDRNLVYALGGITEAQISSGARLDSYHFSNHNVVFSGQSGWKSGYVLGAGWETALTDHVTLKAEYSYANYGSVSSYYFHSSGNLTYGAASSGEVAVQSVRAALSYKF